MDPSGRSTPRRQTSTSSIWRPARCGASSTPAPRRTPPSTSSCGAERSRRRRRREASPSTEGPASLQRDEDAVANLAVDRLREVALAGRVLDQDHLAGADASRLAVARGDLDARVEVDDVLASRRGVPVEVVVGLHLAEDDPVGREPLGQPAGPRRLRVLALHVLLVGLAVLVRVKPMDLHRSLLPQGGPIIVRPGRGGKNGYTPADDGKAGRQPRRRRRTAPRDARAGRTARA